MTVRNAARKLTTDAVHASVLRKALRATASWLAVGILVMSSLN